MEKYLTWSHADDMTTGFLNTGSGLCQCGTFTAVIQIKLKIKIRVSGVPLRVLAASDWKERTSEMLYH